MALKVLERLGFPLIVLALVLGACGPGDEGAQDRFILRAPPKADGRSASPPTARPPPEQAAARLENPACRHAPHQAAAEKNAEGLRWLSWAPFGRPEQGWEIYRPLIAREIATDCPPDSPGFAAALAGWQARHQLPQTGVLDEAAFTKMKVNWQQQRRIAIAMRQGCPAPPPESALVQARPEESYGGKTILLRPGALAAYRQMVRAAKAESPEIGADPRNLTIFSGYRSPEHDAARCLRDQNCDGIVRARCSPHRTGLALDLYVGQAPGYGPDSTADPNRLYMSRTATYVWLTANAHRFGFVNYAFEPWHWEWTGEAP